MVLPAGGSGVRSCVSTTPHDSLVRAVFGQVEHAAGLLRCVLPDRVAERIDWSCLAAESGTMVDPQLRQQHSDLLFRTRLAGREAFVYLLFEHQSSPDRHLPFRLLRYEVRIWERWIERNTGRPLPAILPVVLYHGRARWPHSAELAV